MIDIKGEIISIKDEFNSNFITLLDLIEALRKESGASYSEVAQYLLLKLLPYEPIPNHQFEFDTGLCPYKHHMFINSDHIMPYRTPPKIYDQPEEVYFEELKDKLKLLEAFNEIFPF